MNTKIYILVDPSGEIRYAGKTDYSLAKRLCVHISKARKGEKGHKNNWIRSLLKNQQLPTIQLVGKATGNWQKEEKAWIAYFRAEGIRLTNIADGGEGASGSVRSTESRKKMSKNWYISRKGIITGMTGLHHSIETRQKMSNAAKGKKHSIERRRRSSKTQMGKASPRKGKHHSAETKRKMSEARKGCVPWIKGKHHTAETRRKMSETRKGRIPWNKGKKIIK